MISIIDNNIFIHLDNDSIDLEHNIFSSNEYISLNKEPNDNFDYIISNFGDRDDIIF